MIRQLTKFLTSLILVLNFACIYSAEDNPDGYNASLKASSALCRYVDPQLLQEVKQLEVPYVKQKPNYCGPASLAMVLQYFGETDVTQEELGDTIVGSDGTTPAKLRQAAEKLGYNLSVISCGFNNLLSLVEDDKPIIVRILNRTKDNGHYLVVTGYDMKQEYVYVKDPENSNRAKITFSEFKQLWDISTLAAESNSQNLMMVVSKQ